MNQYNAYFHIGNSLAARCSVCVSVFPDVSAPIGDKLFRQNQSITAGLFSMFIPVDTAAFE